MFTIILLIFSCPLDNCSVDFLYKFQQIKSTKFLAKKFEMSDLMSINKETKKVFNFEVVLVG